MQLYNCRGSIRRGLDNPRRAFAVYLASKLPDLYDAVICFTRDDKVVFGLSIDDADAQPENLETAKRILERLCRIVDGITGVIVTEEPPPRSEEEFKALPQRRAVEYYRG